MSKSRAVPRRQVTPPPASTAGATGNQEPEVVKMVQLEGESDEAFAARLEAAGIAPEANDVDGDGKADEAEAQAKATAEAEAKVAEQAAAQAKEAAVKAKADLAAAEEAAANAEYQSQAKAKAAILEAENKAKLDLVDVVVPKTFNLMLDSHEVITYRDGTYPMPRKHAEHWYAKAHGVRLYTGVKG